MEPGFRLLGEAATLREERGSCAKVIGVRLGRGFHFLGEAATGSGGEAADERVGVLGEEQADLSPSPGGSILRVPSELGLLTSSATKDGTFESHFSSVRTRGAAGRPRLRLSKRLRLEAEHKKSGSGLLRARCDT